MSEQFTVFQESACQIRLALDPTLGLANLAMDLTDMIRTKVRHFSSGYVCPEIFNRVQIRSIRGQRFCPQPTSLRPDVIFNDPATVCGQRIPDKKQLASAQHTFKPFQMSNHIGTANRTIFRTKKQPDLASSRSCDQCSDGRQALPTERLPQDRGLSARRPRPAHGRSLGKAAFVQESDEPVQLADFFLRRGQRSSVHCRTTLLLRLRACLSGFWQLHPSPRRRRQTC